VSEGDTLKDNRGEAQQKPRKISLKSKERSRSCALGQYRIRYRT
jgi:hypothetical protein